MGKPGTDNEAVMAGYTWELIGECMECDMALLVTPGQDLDDRFKAFCTDTQEWVTINGWLWSFEEPEALEYDDRMTMADLDASGSGFAITWAGY